MPQLLASTADIEAWLESNKVRVTDSNTAKYQIEANRIIKSSLSGVFTPTILFGWSSPENTPGLIRSIASELIAAYLYRELYSEDVPDVPEYAKALYDEAIAKLTAIREGTMIVLDENDEPIGENLLSGSALDFWPNDTTEGPYFKMADKFG